MIKVSAVIDDKGARSFAVDLGDLAVDRQELNKVLGFRLVQVLKEHWSIKNTKPNKLGGERTNFWQRAAENTVLESVSEDGATVAVGDEIGTQIGIHIYGGTIFPRVAKALTIPLVREAHGLRARLYEEKFNTDLFTFAGQNVLFEKVGRGGSQSVHGNRMGYKQRSQVPFGPQTIPGNKRSVRGRSTVVPLVHRQELRAVYALADSADIDPDPGALPPEEEMLSALQEEAEDWFDLFGGGAG